jgi:hypothetical protein
MLNILQLLPVNGMFKTLSVSLQNKIPAASSKFYFIFAL